MKKSFIIGPRIYKTGIAAGVALYISQLVGTQSPFFSVIAAVVALQPTVHESINVSKQRMLGTILGISVGVAFAYIAVGNPIAVSLGVIVILAVSNYIGWTASSVLACIAFASLATKPGDPISAGAFRILDTFIGVTVAILVNYSFGALPLERQASKALQQALQQTIQVARKSIEQYIRGNIQAKELQKIQEEAAGLFEQAEKAKHTYKKEAKYKKYENDRMNEFECIYKEMQEIFHFAKSITKEAMVGSKSALPPQIHEDLMDISRILSQIHEPLVEELFHAQQVSLQPLQEKVQSIQRQLEKDKMIFSMETSIESLRHFLNLFYNIEEMTKGLERLQHLCSIENE